MRADFVDDRLYATDCGPVCTCDSRATLWIYSVDGESPNRRTRLGAYVTAQCACCHRVEGFDLPDHDEANFTTTIGDVKRAHFDHRIRHNATTEAAA